MSEVTRCHHCRKDLSTVKEIHAAEGMLFCSASCALNHQMDLIIMSAKEQAKEWYNEYAEVVTPSDIGIVPSDTDEDADEDTDDDQATCEWCENEMDEDMLTRTNLGMLCDRCIAAIRSRGESIIIYEGDY